MTAFIVHLANDVCSQIKHSFISKLIKLDQILHLLRKLGVSGQSDAQAVEVLVFLFGVVAFLELLRDFQVR